MNAGRQKESGFVKNSVAYSGSNVFIQFIRLVKDFIVRRILPPEIMGFWNFVVVLQGIVGIFDLGCNTGAARELPIIKGNKDTEEEGKIRSTTLWFTFLQNIFISLFAVLYIWWNRANYVPWEITAAYIGIIIFLIMSLQTVYVTFFTAAQAFVPLSKLLLIGSVVEGISFPLCSYIWGLGGLMVAAVISSCFNVLLFFFNSKLHIRLRIFWSTLKRLLSFGFFLRLVDYPNSFFMMANIIWVTKFMSIESLALFSMARGFFFQVSNISTMSRTVYAMRFLEQSGSGIPRHVLAVQKKQFLLFQLLVVVPLLSWAAGVVLPFIVRNFIPKYSGANEAILILLICSFFYVLNSGLTVQWILEKKLIARGAANIFGLAAMVSALAATWFLLGRKDINDMAYATLAGYFLFFVYMVIVVGKDIWQPHVSAEIILSVTIAAAWTYFILQKGYTYVESTSGFSEDLKATLSMGSLSLLALLPVPLYGFKRSKIMQWGWR